MSSPTSKGNSSNRRRHHKTAGNFPALTTAAAPVEASASTTTTALPLADALLQNLAEACRIHQKKHHNHHHSPEEDSYYQENRHDSQRLLPPSCQTSLDTLARVIVKVEDTYRAHKQPALDHVKHVCDFYSNVCRGGFCPHAPHLFKQGRKGEEVLPRVYSLMEHLITKSVMTNHVIAKSTHSISLHETLVQTMVRLLLLIPEASLQTVIVESLVQLLVDVTTIRIMFTEQQKRSYSSAGPVPLDVSLVPSSNTTTTTTTVTNTTATATYLLHIQSLEQALSLQAALLHMLTSYLRLLTDKRNQSLHHAAVIIDQDECAVRMRLSNVTRSKLMRVVEYTLLCRSTTLPSSSISDEKKRKLDCFVRNNQVQALHLLADVLIMIMIEGDDDARQRLQISTLLAESTRLYFVQKQQQDQQQQQDNGKDERAALLTQLLVKTMLSWMPAVAETPSLSSSSSSSSATILWPIWMDCLGYIAPDSIQVNDRNQVLSDDHMYLSTVCMTMIHQTLFTHRVLLNSALWSAATLVQTLIRLFSDPRLAHSAVGVVVLLLEKEHFEGIQKSVTMLLLTNDENTMANKTHTLNNKRLTKQVEAKNSDDGSPLKRQKTGVDNASVVGHSDTVDVAPAGFFEEQLSCFLINCARPAATRLCAITPVTVSTECIADVMAVSSAIRLLVSHVELNERAQQDPLSLAALLSLLLESMIGFCNMLMSCTETCSTCVSICVDCGVYVNSCARNHALLTVLAKRARLLCLKASWVDKMNEDTASLVVCPLSKESALSIFVVNQMQAKVSCRMDLFQGVSLVVILDKSASDVSCVLSFDFIGKSMDGNADRQRERLAYLRLKESGSTQVRRGDASVDAVMKETWEWVNKSVRAEKAEEDPCVRLLWWQSIGWLVFMEPESIRRFVVSSTRGKELIVQFLAVAMADRNCFVKDYASREIGAVLSAGNGLSIVAFVGDKDEWKNATENVASACASRHQITDWLFQEVDRLLHEHASVPQALLSYTVKDLSSRTKQAASKKSPIEVLASQRCAVRALVSMASVTGAQSNKLMKLFFENAFKRIIGLSGGDGSPDPIATRGLCHGELSILCATLNLPELLQSCLETVATELFYNVLVPCTGFEVEPSRRAIAIESIPTVRREQRHRLLCNMIQRFMLTRTRTAELPVASYASDVLKFVDSTLPWVVSQFVVEKEYDALRLCTEFKLFAMQLNRNEEKSRVRPSLRDNRVAWNMSTDLLVGAVNIRRVVKKLWALNLEDETRRLCLTSHFVERVLANVFIKGGRTELVFFMKVVLQDKLSLKTIMLQKELLIVKELVWQLGNPATDSSIRASRALNTAALAKMHDSMKLLFPNDEVDGASTGDENVGIEWISSHFMFLLVNVIQYRWSSKTYLERVQSLRCLSIMVDHLRFSDSSQYVPQVMATVNAAIGNSVDRHFATELTVCAIEVLSQFVKLVARHQWKALGQNLASIVVSLVPVLSINEGDVVNKRSSYETAARVAAITLLEWLTQGELGKKLAPHFNEIPFLPSCELLAGVRSNLRTVGVDFDNLQIAVNGTPGVQRHSPTSDGSVTGEAARKQEALRRRLEIVRPLLSNENASIRNVSLQYIAALLKANREFFHLLVDNEGAVSMGRYLTIAYEGRCRSRGIVSDLVETLLSRCVDETDSDARLSLAVCFGEVGAIDSNRLDESKAPTFWSKGVNKPGESPLSPPWQSNPVCYKLHLVTKDLVLGLKASPTSNDQNKIAHAIQQLLVLLDATGQGNGEKGPENILDKTCDLEKDKKKMSDWLVSKLAADDVLDVVEPFWSTEYREVADKAPTKQPPFFLESKTYYHWMSNWCRYMIRNAYDGERTGWVDMFYACQSAVRSPAGVGVAETLLPILILDRLCFGRSKDEREIVDEMTLALDFETLSTMDAADRQKAVNTVFTVAETLEHWAEEETERKHGPRGRESGKENVPSESEWPRDSSLIRIEDLMKAVPLALRARAAANVGMHARALRLLELAARKSCASSVFDSSQDKMLMNKKSRAAGICSPEDMHLMKDVLAALSDYDTMTSLLSDHMRLDPELRISDSIRQKEATGDWEGALQDHEHSQQILGSNPTSRYGSLKCLLELGHFESVLNQVNGLVKAPNGQNASELGPELDMVCPFAIEAAWRLGRWETLDELVSWGSNSSKGSPDSRYQTSLGSIMLGIKRHDHLHIETELKEARSAVMVRLSSCARESYSRAYNLVVQLQCLREIEDSAELLCSSDVVDLESQSMDWFWNRRLEFLSSSGASTVIKARLALSRLAKDTALEGSLFLNLGKRARKGTLRNIAGSCFAQAETALLSISNEKTSALKRCTLHRQLAKLKHDCGESSAALSLLQLDNEEGLASESPAILQSTASRYVYSILQNLDEDILSESHIVDVYSRSLLQTTRWMIEGSLKDGAQIKDRFTILHRLSPRWEKGHFQYAKYIDSMLESRIEAIQRRTPERYHGLDEEKMRSQCLGDDKVCHQNILLAIQHYVEALKLDTKNVYHALPRLLSLWFDFTAIVIHEDGLTTKKPQGAADARVLSMAQEETNALIANEYKSIPPLAFYTAMPQLISRVTHTSNDTERIVRTILTRVLTKHPEQAMWPLGWLRQSQLKERREIGDALFQQAESTLLKLGGNNNLHRNKVLVESKSLFKHLHDIAVYKVSDMTVNKINVKPWKGVVQLCDFIPPIQAALSVSILSGGNSTFRESFPRHVPRMRSFSQQVGVMGSKARPKKLKAFIVSTDTCRSSATLSNSAERRSIDIGEIHFLVKQEAKGDLRKDARVQDFNNVVNRLIVSSTFEKGASQYSRRLRLRTYTVTCLSEDTGILEWVPNTDSLRSLIAKSYNPQASPFSAKRRGHRVANFGDPMLRTNFEKKCQPMFFENGNLRRAATMFDELCLKPYPPLLYWWFVQHFPDPHSWYEARTRFTLSAAVWSGVGHVIGLGDRHSENILVDTTCGECVHVDFDCIFDKGLTLPKPETVPFRLTHNMIDAFGPTGVDGVYTGCLNAAMCVLRNNHDTLLSVLEPFVKDPIIDWRRLRSQQKSNNKQSATGTSDRQTLEAKRSILVIDQRLNGIYNLRNPNFKKIQRSDLRGAESPDDDLTHLVPLTVDGQVHKMISEATSSENLVQLYVGWMPWL